MHFLHWSLFVKSQQNRIELVTRPGKQQVPSKPPDPEGGEGSGDETPSGGTDELKRQSDELNSKGEVILLENKEETR